MEKSERREGEGALVEAAREARSAAYAPYSDFFVGAAVRTTSGDVYTGVNVENASYGLAVCAERHAVATAVRGGMRAGELEAVAVVGDSPGAFSPCGACRQVLAEFAAAGAQVWIHNLHSETTQNHLLESLLPLAFDRKSLTPP